MGSPRCTCRMCASGPLSARWRLRGALTRSVTSSEGSLTAKCVSGDGRLAACGTPANVVRWNHVLVRGGGLSWPEVAARLAAARTYWLCTTMPSGAPHAAPVWGVVIGPTLYLYSERRTVKARNLAADPRVVVHLESARTWWPCGAPPTTRPRSAAGLPEHLTTACGTWSSCPDSLRQPLWRPHERQKRGWFA
jgi:hypothetical protein